VKGFIKNTLRTHLLSENYTNNKFIFSKSPNGEIITLYSNDQMVGDIELAYSDSEMEILQLDVLDKYRGGGYAKLLMNKAINHATKKGLNSVILEPEPMDTKGIDKAGLYSFYSKFGFVDTKDGKMVLNLNGGESLNEAAKMLNDLSLTTGLFDTGEYLVLYDYQNNVLYGMIAIYPENDFYYIGAVAAQKGYGPLMYELGMTKASPKGLSADRDSSTTTSAINVFKGMEKRGVKKRVIPSDSDEFIKYFDKSPEDNIILNTIYFYEDKPTYNKLSQVANNYLSTVEDKSTVLDNLSEKAYSLFSSSLNEGIVKSELVNIDDDDLYDSLDNQANTLRTTSEISFGSADPFEILYDDETGHLVGATWIETSGAFSPHMIIDPEYRKMGLSQKLIDGVVEKYKKMKQLRGDNYTFMLNVVNNSLANTMEKHYGFKKVSEDPHGNITMTL
jgi:ribosomal protein S18 acetylase RimI-like enzyme